MISAQRGVAALGLIAIALAVLVIAGIGRYGYVEYRRNHWDATVREMCAKEGGIEVFERVALRDQRYLDSDMNIRIPAKLEHPPGYGQLPFEAKPDDLFFRQMTTTIIHMESPRVARNDILVIRSSDKKILGKATSFGRVGGDFVAIDFESRFICPADADEPNLFKKVFTIEIAPGTKQ